MAAACSLLEAPNRCQVTLVERRPYLGGRAFSFVDPETGFEVDNGQHVFLGCCSYYIDFLKKLGTFPMTHLQPTLQLKVMNGKGKAGHLGVAPLPAPFHLVPSFLQFPHLSLKDKLLAIYGLVRVRFTNRHHASLERESFHQWLKRHHQTERAITNLWNLIILPTLNDDIRQVSAAMGLMIFQDAVLKSRTTSAVGYSRVGLSTLMGDTANSHIEQNGGQLLLGKQVARLSVEDDRVQGVELRGGEVIKGDVYISALPFDILKAVIPVDKLPPDASSFFQKIGGLSTAPIVNVHLWYDRPVMKEEFVAFVDHPIQWVFNKSRILSNNHPPATPTTISISLEEEPSTAIPIEEEWQYLCISLSGAWDYIQMPKEELLEMFIEAMASVFPEAKDARVMRSLIVKQDQATFRCIPGAADMRASTQTPLENLFLAGDWTDTGWPSTMEGAVRSGVKTAQAIRSRR